MSTTVIWYTSSSIINYRKYICQFTNRSVSLFMFDSLELVDDDKKFTNNIDDFLKGLE